MRRGALACFVAASACASRSPARPTTTPARWAELTAALDRERAGEPGAPWTARLRAPGDSVRYVDEGGALRVDISLESTQSGAAPGDAFRDADAVSVARPHDAELVKGP
ncbi:MAG TPA: hypothetical protein VKU41_30035 [Polyangiaceae bacterium]|nr:hypothetical protein [Polyangiaceae bacterium]